MNNIKRLIHIGVLMLVADNKSNTEDLSDIIKNRFMSGHPLFEKMNFTATVIDVGFAQIRAPFDSVFLDNRGALHRGVLVTLADTACGMATFSALGKFVPIATVDLRIDYSGVIAPGADLEARIRCQYVGPNSAHTHGEILSIMPNENNETVVARISSVFAVNIPGKSFDEGLKEFTK